MRMSTSFIYELVGTTNIPRTTFQTLDGSATITTTLFNGIDAFGVGGFVNCSKPGAGEDAHGGRNFLHESGRARSADYTNTGDQPCLVASVGGPDPDYRR